MCQGKFQLFLLRQQTFTSLHVTLFVLICTHSLLSLLIFLWCWQDRWKLREETYHHSLCSCDRFRLNLRKWKQRTVLWKRPRSWEDLLRWINARGGFSWGLCSGEQEVQGTLVQWFFAPCHKTGWQKFNHLRPDAWMSHMSLDSLIERFAAQVSTKLAGVSCIAAWWKSLILTFTQWPPLSVGSVDPNIYLPGDEASASTSLDGPRGTWWNQLSQKPWWRAHGTAYSGTGHQVFRVSWNALFNFYRFCFGDVCFSIRQKVGQLTMKVINLSKSNLGDEAIWTEWHAGKNATHSAYLQRLCVDSMITKCTGHLGSWRKCMWLGLRVRPVQWFKRIWSPNLRIVSTSAGHGDSTKTSPTFYPHHEDRDHSSSRSPPRRSWVFLLSFPFAFSSRFESVPFLSLVRQQYPGHFLKLFKLGPWVLAPDRQDDEVLHSNTSYK